MVDPSLARLSDQLFWVALSVYAVAMVLYFGALAYRGRRLATTASIVAWAGWLAHAASLATRGLAVGRVPWGNMFEYSSTLGLVLVLAYLLVFERRLGLRQIGGFALGAGVIALASARFLYAPAGPLLPALNSYWLRIHVIAAIVGSALFGVSFIFTMLYLIRARADRRAGLSTVGAAHVDTFEPGMPSDLDAEEPLVHAKQPRGIASRLPPAETLDQLAYRTIQFAFPVWTFAVIAGAIWAHEAWSRYWGWDPKETWAFVTWVVYAGYLHARSTAGWRGTRASVINCVGFGCVLFTYFAVNLWIADSLHSYAGVN